MLLVHLLSLRSQSEYALAHMTLHRGRQGLALLGPREGCTRRASPPASARRTMMRCTDSALVSQEPLRGVYSMCITRQDVRPWKRSM